jgi:hypothetical protein
VPVPAHERAEDPRREPAQQVLGDGPGHGRAPLRGTLPSLGVPRSARNSHPDPTVRSLRSLTEGRRCPRRPGGCRRTHPWRPD